MHLASEAIIRTFFRPDFRQRRPASLAYAGGNAKNSLIVASLWLETKRKAKRVELTQATRRCENLRLALPRGQQSSKVFADGFELQGPPRCCMQKWPRPLHSPRIQGGCRRRRQGYIRLRLRRQGYIHRCRWESEKLRVHLLAKRETAKYTTARKTTYPLQKSQQPPRKVRKNGSTARINRHLRRTPTTVTLMRMCNNAGVFCCWLAEFFYLQQTRTSIFESELEHSILRVFCSYLEHYGICSAHSRSHTYGILFLWDIQLTFDW